MWALTNHTPFQVERTWVRDAQGAHQWIVVVKATYDIAADGTLALSQTPVEPLFTPVYQDAAGESSLRFEADMVPMKPGTDVYLNATAHAPHGKARTRLKVSLRLNRLYKELLVHGDRTWSRTLTGGLSPSSPEAFQTMPITYERAFGGADLQDTNPRKHRIDFRNPVGTGIAADTGQLVGKPVANIEPPTQQPGEAWPAGFGAVASFWSPRKELAGTYDDHWVAHRHPLLPTDYDPRFLLCSPLDQQAPAYLKGGEVVELTNLTPSGQLRLVLPKTSFRFQTHFGRNREEHASALVSVIIEPDRSRLIMVWQTSLPVAQSDADYLDRTVIREMDRSR